MQQFTLKVIWLNYTLGLAVDHIVKGGKSPLSSYFFWPRDDAWSQIKTELESKPWISNYDKINLLNQVTLIIDYWQKYKAIQSAIEVRQKFPDIVLYEDY